MSTVEVGKPTTEFEEDILNHAPVDSALKVVLKAGELEDPPTEEELKKVLRKIDFRILPCLIVCYTFFYIDKTTLSYAAIFGLKEDLNLQGTEYSWLSSVFYFGYMAWAFPTNYFLLKLPVAKYLGANIFMWGVFLMIQAACKNFAGLAAVRAFGGAAEAAADPAFLLVTSMWYTRKEQPVRIGIWYTANGVGIALGGLLGYGIGNINGALASWKYEFLIIGCLCAAWGIVIFFMLPDSPVNNRFFSEREKQLVIYRLRENNTGVETKVFKWYQVKEAFLDIKTYLFFLITLFGNIPNGGISNFGTLIIQGFGYSTLGTTLLQIPNGAVCGIAILSCVLINNKLKGNKRIVMLVIYMLPNVAGAFGLYFVAQEHKVGRLICYYLTAPYNAAFVLLLSLNTGNTAGHTKKVVVNAVLFLGYCVGNIAGPFFYKTSQAPRYPLGMGSLIFSHLMEIILAIVLGFLLHFENKRRDSLQAERNDDLAFDDLTDKENPNFRYVY